MLHCSVYCALHAQLGIGLSCAYLSATKWWTPTVKGNNSKLSRNIFGSLHDFGLQRLYVPCVVRTCCVLHWRGRVWGTASDLLLFVMWLLSFHLFLPPLPSPYLHPLQVSLTCYPPSTLSLYVSNDQHIHQIYIWAYTTSHPCMNMCNIQTP